MNRLLALAAVLAALGATVPATAATQAQQLPPAPLAGTHACAPAPFTRALRVRGATCHRARQVSHFWERHRRCVAGWTEKRYALPSGVNATGGSYINCRRGRARRVLGRSGRVALPSAA
jgi:hypothetical protein